VNVGNNVGVGVGVGIGNPANPNSPLNPNAPDAAGIVARMSPSELQQAKKQCRQILASSSSFDNELVALCKLVRTASR
jgi:hypothetical protein